jgi:hypothetical protein
MTDRERWTIYPLIFLTLGIALKDKLVEVVDLQCRNLICNALVVTDQKGSQRAVVSSDAEGGYVRTRGTKNGLTVILGNTERLGGLMFVDSKGTVNVNPGSIYQAPARSPEAQPAEAGDDAQADDAQADDAPQDRPPAPDAAP